MALWNISNVSPSLSKILSNTYQEDIQLFIDWELCFLREGTTQGDPYAMTMYAIAISSKCL